MASISSISSVSAFVVEEIDNNTAKVIEDKDAPSMNVNKGEVITKKSKSKKTTTTYVRIKYKEKVRFNANAFSLQGNSLKVNSAVWDFGDKTGIQKGIGKYHTYKKPGWYKVKLTLNATGYSDYSFIPTFGKYKNTKWIDSTKTFSIYISKGPDLVTKKVAKYGTDSKNTKYMVITVKNTGYSTSKPCYVKINYANKKLKKYTMYAKIPKITAGKSKNIKINFKIPWKYRNYIKYIKLDYKNAIYESYKENNIMSIR